MVRKLLAIPRWVWAVQFGYVFLCLVFLLVLLQNLDSGLVSFWGRKLFILIFVIVMLGMNIVWRMVLARQKYVLTVSVIVASFIVNVTIAQAFILDSAHSSFDNYSHFRDCITVLSKKDTSGTCRLANGQTITIVEYKNKWYLSGDLPL